MQVVGQHPFLSPGKMHHAVGVELVPGQAGEQCPHHEMNREEQAEKKPSLPVANTVSQHIHRTGSGSWKALMPAVNPVQGEYTDGHAER